MAAQAGDAEPADGFNDGQDGHGKAIGLCNGDATAPGGSLARIDGVAKFCTVCLARGEGDFGAFRDQAALHSRQARHRDGA